MAIGWWLAAALMFGRPDVPQHLWMEAESFGPLQGANFSFMQEKLLTRGSWSLAGPDTAASWTQGGESEFMSIAARGDEQAEIACRRDITIPQSGDFTLWVRYADYRAREEAFGVRIRQGDKVFTQGFGRVPKVDELDPMKLYWDWAYAWDSAPVTLQKGTATIELFTTGVTEARRCVDCLCLTTDAAYHPVGREKPDFAAWHPLREMQKAGIPAVEPLLPAQSIGEIPQAWRIADGPPTFLWNVGEPWAEELKKPLPQRVESPFSVDPPLLKDFLAAFQGKQPPIYSHPLSGPVWHIPLYPAAFSPGSPFLDWLDRHPQQKFGILLNYGEPNWAANANHAAINANLEKVKDRFVGYVAGENIAYASLDNAELERRIRAAKSRAEVLAILRDLHTAATIKKFGDYEGKPLTAEAAWGQVISCLSASNEAYVHALCDWGVRRIGHENTGNSPTLARRLAFLRGASRQFGAQMVDYQSCNLGDSATMFSREHYFYPASSRFILDNSYDAWAGAGINWLLKDYLLWHLAGVSAFYNEQGIDLFWKPGGNSAGDEFPVQLSPKGKVAEAMLKLASEHPRGVSYTPVAFLLDEAHGYTQERFESGAFGINPEWNPTALTPGRHEDAIRGWFDIAYYPTAERQNEPANGIGQTYVNGIFGDIFDVIVNAPKRTSILSTYRVVIVAGEVSISEEWGRALKEYMRRGGTLVVCTDQLSGPGVKTLELPDVGPAQEASSFVWKFGTLPNAPVNELSSNYFAYHPLNVNNEPVLAATHDGAPLMVARQEGRGQLITIGIPLGLGLDSRPVPMLGLLLRHLTEGLVPIKVNGDVEWTLNRLDDGGWLVALLNNKGINKPQHGILPTDHRQAQTVTLRVPYGVGRSEEWMTNQPVIWKNADQSSSVTLTIPAGAVRLIAISPHK